MKIDEIKKEFIEDLGFEYVGEIICEEGFENCERSQIKIYDYPAELKTSLEMPQDIRSYQILLYKDRAGPISQEQITEWKESYNQIQAMNLDKIREKVIFDWDLFCELKEQNSWFKEGDWKEPFWRV